MLFFILGILVMHKGKSFWCKEENTPEWNASESTHLQAAAQALVLSS